MNRITQPETANDFNLIAIVKGREYYVFIYDAATRAECIRTFSLFAANPDLSFTWYDAARLAQRVRGETVE